LPWSEGQVLADFSADVGALVTEAQAEGGELLGDLDVGERRGEGDVGVAAVVAFPCAAGVDGTDAGDVAVDGLFVRWPPPAATCDGYRV
jgi:hypothetical protein